MLFVSLANFLYITILIGFMYAAKEGKLNQTQLLKRVFSILGLTVIVGVMAKISADYNSKELSGIFAMLSTVLMYVQTKIATK